MNNCICNRLKEGESKFLSSSGNNTMYMELKYKKYRIGSVKDNHTNIVETIINYCPLCGRKLESEGNNNE